MNSLLILTSVIIATTSGHYTYSVPQHAVDYAKGAEIYQSGLELQQHKGLGVQAQAYAAQSHQQHGFGGQSQGFGGDAHKFIGQHSFGGDANKIIAQSHNFGGDSKEQGHKFANQVHKFMSQPQAHSFVVEPHKLPTPTHTFVVEPHKAIGQSSDFGVHKFISQPHGFGEGHKFAQSQSFGGDAHKLIGQSHVFVGDSHKFGQSQSFGGDAHKFIGQSQVFGGDAHKFIGQSQEFDGESHGFASQSHESSAEEHGFSGQSVGYSGEQHEIHGGKSEGEKSAKILKQDYENHGHAYTYSYATDNGIKAQESGKVEGKSLSVEGEYSYTGHDGQTYTVHYTADENGFRPSGAHLPTPPPVPEGILKSLEQNAHEEANGIFDDGSYKESHSSEEQLPQYESSYEHYQPQAATEAPQVHHQTHAFQGQGFQGHHQQPQAFHGEHQAFSGGFSHGATVHVTNSNGGGYHYGH
ncbi:hypothetical protein JYU34_014101 [Plutella xylostella]|uniref:Cuticular protein n=1 Tax=Plutella xylostella TaxID=51655 RepID=A0ABQ7Q909_PLUXY|nr:hypothetical protein JYU34_014101 [Plutella xylostella]